MSEDWNAGTPDDQKLRVLQCIRLLLRAPAHQHQFVQVRARWVTLRARWVPLRAHWVSLRARLGVAMSSLGAAESSLGDTKSSLGSCRWAAWLCCVPCSASSLQVRVDSTLAVVPRHRETSLPCPGVARCRVRDAGGAPVGGTDSGHEGVAM